MKANKRIGLSLSGGGYRAAAFHLGTLKKLHGLGVLNNVDVLSTISGGSIAGAYYLLNKNDFKAFEDGLTKSLKKSVIKRIILSWPIILILVGVIISLWALSYFFKSNVILVEVLGMISLTTVIFFFQFFFLPFTSLKIAAYKKIFFGDSTLSDLPDHPEIAINATNLETGTLWTFSKRKVSDSSYEYPKDGGSKITFKANNFPIAIAVASSTSVPVPFGPVKIDKQYFTKEEDFERVKPSLSDGGLYDNQGLHKLTQLNSSYFCDIVICSDGSQPFTKKFAGFNSFHVLYRATDIMMRKIKSLQFIRDVYSQKIEIAYYSLDWEYEMCIISFIRAIKENQVSQSVLDCHAFPTDFFTGTYKNRKDEVTSYIKEKIGYSSIIAKGLTKDEIKYTCSIPTNLTALSEKQIDFLSRHAEVLTEIQVKLYCPTLS